MKRLMASDQNELLKSDLFDENAFYKQFMSDISKCGHELIIESPFLTKKRVTMLLPTLLKLKW